MKKMNKMYEAPKAEMIQMNVDKNFMAGGEGESTQTIVDPEL